MENFKRDKIERVLGIYTKLLRPRQSEDKGLRKRVQC